MTEILEINTLEALHDEMNAPRAVIDFARRNGCVPCQRLEPHFKAAAGAPVLEDIQFSKVMLDEAPVDLLDYCVDILNVRGTPTVIEFRNGERHADIAGRTAPLIIKELSV